MLMYRSALLSQRLVPYLTRGRYYNGITKQKRCKTSSSSCTGGEASKGKGAVGGSDQTKNVKWTDKEEAPKWLRKMAPTKGGTELPTPKEAAVIGVVLMAGYYAWFIDPPKKSAEVADDA